MQAYFLPSCRGFWLIDILVKGSLTSLLKMQPPACTPLPVALVLFVSVAFITICWLCMCFIRKEAYFVHGCTLKSKISAWDIVRNLVNIYLLSRWMKVLQKVINDAGNSKQWYRAAYQGGSLYLDKREGLSGRRWYLNWGSPWRKSQPCKGKGTVFLLEGTVNFTNIPWGRSELAFVPFQDGRRLQQDGRRGHWGGLGNRGNHMAWVSNWSEGKLEAIGEINLG